MTINELKQLAVYAAKGQAPTNFSVENVDEALADGLREMAGSVNQFMKNRYDIYDIVIQAADEIVPQKVIDSFSLKFSKFLKEQKLCSEQSLEK